MKTIRSGVLPGILAAILSSAYQAAAQDWSLRDNPELAAWFEEEVSRLEQQNDLTLFKSMAEWQDAKGTLLHVPLCAALQRQEQEKM